MTLKLEYFYLLIKNKYFYNLYSKEPYIYFILQSSLLVPKSFS